MILAHPDASGLVIAGDDDLLPRLAAGWLLGYPSPPTRGASARDLDNLAHRCTEPDVAVLAASRVHVDA